MQFETAVWELVQLIAALQLQALVVVDDFNYPNVCWKGCSASQPQSKWFLQCIDDNFLVQMVAEPNRRRALLDLILTRRGVWLKVGKG